MNGPEHYKQAELMLQRMDDLPDREIEAFSAGDPGAVAMVTLMVSTAQVHATLALAAATATQLVAQFVELDDDAFAWNEAAGTPPRRVEDVHLPAWEMRT